MPRVTIVLPVYNHARFVEETLQSIFAQDFKDFGVIAVDDGSTDNSLDILERHRSRVRVLHSPHRGPASARNQALRVADSELIAFMDADDLCSVSRLRLQVERMDAGGLDLVASTLSFIDASGRALPGLWQCPEHGSKDYWAALLERNWIGTPSVLLRRKILETSGLFDESFTHAEDYDLWLRAGAGRAIGYIREPLIRCRRHGANTSADIEAHQYFERQALKKVDPTQARLAFARLYREHRERDEAWIWFLLRSANAAFEEEARAALSRHMASPLLRFAQGVFLFDCGEWTAARDAFLTLPRSDAAALHNCGVLTALCGDPKTAERHLHNALALLPDYQDARFNLHALRNGGRLRLTRRPLRKNPVPAAL